MIRRLLSLFTRRGWMADEATSLFCDLQDQAIDRDAAAARDGFPFAPVSARAVALMWEHRS